MDLLRMVISRFRTSAIAFGLMLLLIAGWILDRVSVLDATEAFWLALGVVLGAYATSMNKLVDDTPPPSNVPTSVVEKLIEANMINRERDNQE